MDREGCRKSNFDARLDVLAFQNILLRSGSKEIENGFAKYTFVGHNYEGD